MIVIVTLCSRYEQVKNQPESSSPNTPKSVPKFEKPISNTTYSSSNTKYETPLSSSPQLPPSSPNSTAKAELSLLSRLVAPPPVSSDDILKIHNLFSDWTIDDISRNKQSETVLKVSNDNKSHMSDIMNSLSLGDSNEGEEDLLDLLDKKR